MTSSSPVPTPVHTVPRAGAAVPPPAGSARPEIWFLAHCDRCGGDAFAQPFRSLADRDAWAVEHLVGTGHTVSVSIEDVPTDTHTSGYLRRTDDGDGFKWLCMAGQCVKWTGPFDTPQLALADMRSHARIGAAR